MPRKPNQQRDLSKVRQIMETDLIKVANTLIKDGDWILINTYKRYRGHFFYVLGRVKDF